MSTIERAEGAHDPGDERLKQMYNEVLTVFRPGTGDQESAYADAGGVANGIFRSQHPNSSSPTVSTTRSPRSYRPLPPTPGTSLMNHFSPPSIPAPPSSVDRNEGGSQSVIGVVGPSIPTSGGPVRPIDSSQNPGEQIRAAPPSHVPSSPPPLTALRYFEEVVPPTPTSSDPQAGPSAPPYPGEADVSPGNNLYQPLPPTTSEDPSSYHSRRRNVPPYSDHIEPARQPQSPYAGDRLLPTPESQPLYGDAPVYGRTADGNQTLSHIPISSSDISGYPLHRVNSTGSSNSYTYSDVDGYPIVHSPPPRARAELGRRNTTTLHAIIYGGRDNMTDYSGPADSGPAEEEIYPAEESFVNYSLLSHLAVLLRDHVVRGVHVKGNVPYPNAFTGRDVVTTVQTQIHRELVEYQSGTAGDRKAALHVARSLQNQLFFHEVEWNGRVLQDGVEDVYRFLDEQEDERPAEQELPTSVVTFLTRCYSVLCEKGMECYSPRCPRKNKALLQMISKDNEPPASERWTVPPDVIIGLSGREKHRQMLIRKLINKEEEYIADLDHVDSVFVQPLFTADPPIIPQLELQEFIDDVFSNILEIRECNRRFLDIMYVRQREQSHLQVIQEIGDILLDAATVFRQVYPSYIGHFSLALQRLHTELERNPNFRRHIERCSRHSSLTPDDGSFHDLEYYLTRPYEHLRRYPNLLNAILKETTKGNPDAEYLKEAIDAIKNLDTAAQLWTFQYDMCNGPTANWQWQDLVPPHQRQTISNEESQRQATIFELIKSEMEYVRDLENIEAVYLRPLRQADPPIIPPDRLDSFIQDVFHNFAELHAHHVLLVKKLHEIQREEHPRIRSITAAVFDAALNFREAYMEYIPNYPIAEYKIENEMETNLTFKAFVEDCVQHPNAHGLEMKDFVNRPLNRLARYNELLTRIRDESPRTHEDYDNIPNVLDVIMAIGRETEKGRNSAKQKVKLWRYNASIVFKPGEAMDLGLLDNTRSLMHTGKLYRHPDSHPENSGWHQLFLLLFDNYLVLTRPKKHDGVRKYHVVRKPIPLELLSLSNFSDLPVPRGNSVPRHRRPASPSSSVSDSRYSEQGDMRMMYPCTIHYNGRSRGSFTLYVASQEIRAEWKQKLEEALGLRKVIQESNKVFEMETLSIDTFTALPANVNPVTVPWNEGSTITGKVTCSVPFNTPDGRYLVAIGCADGVWIGFRHDPRSLRRVLHLRMVTQCTMLEDFGLFLVLADKSLFAYHIEALVPTFPQDVNASPNPQKLNGNREVQFFSVGNLLDRTLVVYMRKKGNDSHFHVLEPVIDKIYDKSKQSSTRRWIRRAPRSDWFRHYKDFFLPTDCYDLIFLKAKIAILCAKGFEIMELSDFSSSVIPSREDPRLAPLVKRYDTCRPIGIFRVKEDEFLLCYDEFGIYVNDHGDPSREMGTVEWDGHAQSVAFHQPYILLFDPHFIEIRHVETGRLEQIIPGHDIRATWDGRDLNSTHGSTYNDLSATDPSGMMAGGASDGAGPNFAILTTAAGALSSTMTQGARVHAVSNIKETVVQPVGRPPRPMTQHVFQLVPTIPLFLPGSLNSPTNATYFPHSYSPPRSPQVGPPSLTFRY